MNFETNLNYTKAYRQMSKKVVCYQWFEYSLNPIIDSMVLNYCFVHFFKFLGEKFNFFSKNVESLVPLFSS